MSETGKTALLLIGFQNDYIHPDGVLHNAIEDSEGLDQMLGNVFQIIDAVDDDSVLVVHTPIVFSENYEELDEPTGIMKLIKDTEAFKSGTKGAEIIQQFDKYGDRIEVIPGKRGLNAFSNTDLASRLAAENVVRVCIAGVVTSICVDTAGRTAHDLGYKVSILEDATCGRNAFEQKYYCENVFPLYADVWTSQQFLESVGVSV
ncbi:MAG: cysteine hydrolase family protein [Planctomycetota bacterium]|nr:cysteine hydrolase family protein [Planctomycetota bacterium]